MLAESFNFDGSRKKTILVIRNFNNEVRKYRLILGFKPVLIASESCCTTHFARGLIGNSENFDEILKISGTTEKLAKID